MALAFWDGSYIKLDVGDPARPTYLDDFEFPDTDLYGGTPERNAHHATWDRSGDLLLASDEDMAAFHPHYHEFVPDEVPRLAGPYPAGEHHHFDGWGYLHLIDADTLEELDAYAIPEARDPDYMEGHGVLSIHEAKADPDRDLAYIAHYGGGLRVVEFDRAGIREVGHYVGEEGNDLWGVQPVTIDGRRLILASDRDSGLWIFRYTG